LGYPEHDSNQTRDFSCLDPQNLVSRWPNRLLAALTSQEYQRLRSYMEKFTLSFGETLYEPGQIIRTSISQ